MTKIEGNNNPPVNQNPPVEKNKVQQSNEDVEIFSSGNNDVPAGYYDGWSQEEIERDQADRAYYDYSAEPETPPETPKIIEAENDAEAELIGTLMDKYDNVDDHIGDINREILDTRNAEDVAAYEALEHPAVFIPETTEQAKAQDAAREAAIEEVKTNNIPDDKAESYVAMRMNNAWRQTAANEPELQNLNEPVTYEKDPQTGLRVPLEEREFIVRTQDGHYVDPKTIEEPDNNNKEVQVVIEDDKAKVLPPPIDPKTVEQPDNTKQQTEETKDEVKKDEVNKVKTPETNETNKTDSLYTLQDNGDGTVSKKLVDEETYIKLYLEKNPGSNPTKAKQSYRIAKDTLEYENKLGTNTYNKDGTTTNEATGDISAKDTLEIKQKTGSIRVDAAVKTETAGKAESNQTDETANKDHETRVAGANHSIKYLPGSGADVMSKLINPDDPMYKFVMENPTKDNIRAYADYLADNLMLSKEFRRSVTTGNKLGQSNFLRSAREYLKDEISTSKDNKPNDKQSVDFNDWENDLKTKESIERAIKLNLYRITNKFQLKDIPGKVGGIAVNGFGAAWSNSKYQQISLGTNAASNLFNLLDKHNKE